jgi:DNA-binding NarL/FixJ family response regulator
MKKAIKQSIPKIRVLVVDEHPLVGKGIVTLLSKEEDLEVIGHVRNSEASLFLTTSKPEVAVIDLSIRGMQALDVMKQIAYDPRTKIVAIDLANEPAYATRAIKSGAKGYITSDIETTLAEAIRRVAAGQLYVSNDVAQVMVATLAKTSASISGTDPIEALSDRELEMVEAMGRGLSASQISETMGISVKTVETHKAHIKAKLGIATGAQLVRYCVEWYSQRHTARGLSPSIR